MRRAGKLPLDPARAAAVAGLKYVRDQLPGIARIRRGKGFVYIDSEGRRVGDKNEINRIRSLAIPPAWKKVWICPEACGHLQAVGYDARGRKQYRYHPEYRAVRDQTKYERLPEIAAALAVIRKRVREHLDLHEMPREKVLAVVIRLLDVTGIRVGNEESATENKTFGLTTLRNQHVEIEGAKLRFRFTGKSGVRHEVEINDRRVARIVRQCHDLPGHQLFEYIDDSGELRPVSSTDVNAYLREVSGQSLTAKDFRTWAGTVECAVALRDIGEFSSLTEGKKNIVAAIKTAAQRLGNRAPTCRAYYVHPAVTGAYLSGDLLPLMKPSAADTSPADLLKPEERAVLNVIRGQGGRFEELRMTA
jgi:DNA topoisomerase-1